MLWPGCTVSLNGGTTTVEVARAIPGVRALHNGVTVVTNAINIATELTVRPFIKIVVWGGVARPQSYELIGPMASDTLRQLTPDMCFLGATGLDLIAGITANDEAQAAINRVMMSRRSGPSWSPTPPSWVTSGSPASAMSARCPRC